MMAEAWCIYFLKGVHGLCIYFKFYNELIICTKMKTIKNHKPVVLKISVFLLLFSCLTISFSNAQLQKEARDSIIISKAFPFMSFLGKDPDALKILMKDNSLTRQTQQYKARIDIALKECHDVTCFASVVQWTPAEIESIGNDLVRLCKDNNKIKALVSKLRSSGYYSLSESLPDTGFIRAAWNSASTGINKVLDVYIKGKRPYYANIDSISFSRNDNSFILSVQNNLTVEAKKMEEKPFYHVPLNLAIDALSLNGRDEAARYEPLNQGMNKTAYENLKNIDWGKYQYSVMLIPGEGPEKKGVIIDSLGIVRCKLAAQRYKEGLAPLIVVSGGHVHPYKTPYCEAVEMKNYLVKELNIPENVIFIEPHARHTTTNMRNAARMIFRFNIPADKKILVVTNANQNRFLLGMERRFMMELNCVPYRDLIRLNDEMSEYYPVRNALQCNSVDPLDP
jgi:hypothetical protein